LLTENTNYKNRITNFSNRFHSTNSSVSGLTKRNFKMSDTELKEELKKIHAKIDLLLAQKGIKEEMETSPVIKIDHEKNLNRRREIAFKIKTKTS
jgi:hypothetical protein